MKILVTGSRGQLGCELRDILELEAPGLTTYTDIDTLDLRDDCAVARFLREGEYTHIINCAAYT
ncbi:MAG: sugar nucleotide-binding protein, partial [Muribaculaceae bacterium]|nr:sugar nucleotide-binding protein [Muribaculaceae bacterium]